MVFHRSMNPWYTLESLTPVRDNAAMANWYTPGQSQPVSTQLTRVAIRVQGSEHSVYRRRRLGSAP